CVLILFCLYASCALRGLLSFPTRRSSDLRGPGGTFRLGQVYAAEPDRRPRQANVGGDLGGRGEHRQSAGAPPGRAQEAAHRLRRSEEHTSELQSQSNLVCRLLLEKKNLEA